MTPRDWLGKQWNNKVNNGTYPENQTAATYKGLIKLEVLKSYNGKLNPLFEQHMNTYDKTDKLVAARLLWKSSQTKQLS